MSGTWRGRAEPDLPSIDLAGWGRVTLRSGGILCILAATAAVFLPARGAEKLAGEGRPWTPVIASSAFAAILRVLSIHRIAKGRPAGAAMVANHSSWLDVAVIYAGGPVFFVSKAEVASWPVVGVMTRLCGTLFIERRRGDAKRHRDALASRLRAGDRIAFFPEGTSSDGRRVLPFRTTLFAAFADPALAGLGVQPVGLSYEPPPGYPQEFHAWWGGMDFAPHALRVLAAPSGGRVMVRYGAPVAALGDRKALAAALEAAVRDLVPFGSER